MSGIVRDDPDAFAGLTAKEQLELERDRAEEAGVRSPHVDASLIDDLPAFSFSGIFGKLISYSKRDVEALRIPGVLESNTEIRWALSDLRLLRTPQATEVLEKLALHGYELYWPEPMKPMWRKA